LGLTLSKKHFDNFIITFLFIIAAGQTVFKNPHLRKCKTLGDIHMNNSQSYKKVINFRYEVNLQFATKELDKHKIRYRIENDKNEFQIFVKEESYAKAKHIIKALNLDDKLVSQESDGYIKEYSEWTSNQYNPGYYTGGKIQHYLKDKKNWKYFGPAYLLFGVFLFYILLSSTFTNRVYYSIPIPLLFCSIYLFVGIRLTLKAFSK
jgi:hypothetical protein